MPRALLRPQCRLLWCHRPHRVGGQTARPVLCRRLKLGADMGREGRRFSARLRGSCLRGRAIPLDRQMLVFISSVMEPFWKMMREMVIETRYYTIIR